MFRMTLKGMFARKLRLALSATAVVLGVAFVSASFVLGDTISSSFDDHIASANEGADTVVTPAASSGFGQQALPPSAVETIEAVDGVAAVEGAVSGFAQLRSPETGDAPPMSTGISISWIADEQLNPLRVVEGRAPTGADEVVADADTAASLGLGIGDQARLVSNGPVRDVELVGIAQLGEGGISALGIEAGTAEQVFGYPGEFTEIRVRAEEGVSDTVLTDRVEAALAGSGGPSYTVLTGAETTEENTDSISEQTGVITTFLLVFAGITLFVGGFLIVNTFAMLTAQRTRELAVLRALGGSRRQLLGGVLLESALIGAVAGVVGLGLGILVAMGLRSMFGSLGIDLPESALMIEPRTIIVALLLGPVVTAFAALLPARHAAAVQPVEAMREAALPTVSNGRRLVVGSLLTLAAAALVAVGFSKDSASWVGFGAGAGILAVTTFGPMFIGPVTRVLAWPLLRLGGRPTKLALGNVLRSPRRSASTAAALMIGLALVSGTAVIGSSLSGMVDDELEETVRADLVLSAAMRMPFGPETADAVAELPGVATVAGIRIATADVESPGLAEKQRGKYIAGLDPAQAKEVLDLPMVSGSLDGLSAGHVLVSESQGLEIGDTAVVSIEGGGELPLTVAGVYRETAMVENYVLDAEELATVVPHASDMFVLVGAEDGVSTATLEATVDEFLVDAFPLVEADTVPEFADAQSGQIAQAVNMIGILLALSLLIALLGVANTLTLSIIERTREVGMLRAIGMGRRQLRSMVRVEALLMAAYGALVGAGVGVSLGWLLSKVMLEGWDIAVTIPGGRLAAFAALALVAAVGAAMLPARRAARMDVLDAVSTA